MEWRGTGSQARPASSQKNEAIRNQRCCDCLAHPSKRESNATSPSTRFQRRIPRRHTIYQRVRRVKEALIAYPRSPPSLSTLSLVLELERSTNGPARPALPPPLGAGNRP
ncbi:hypothetical protein LZ554_008848 [Drepanopeziza brunnea f. sp. 'monogermtubi']|nr:hypothetical protein LZ554_008848 [Drepanopeziza brunnea f. sp. 'monogermtubi']